MEGEKEVHPPPSHERLDLLEPDLPVGWVDECENEAVLGGDQLDDAVDYRVANSPDDVDGALRFHFAVRVPQGVGSEGVRCRSRAFIDARSCPFTFGLVQPSSAALLPAAAHKIARTLIVRLAPFKGRR